MRRRGKFLLPPYISELYGDTYRCMGLSLVVHMHVKPIFYYATLYSLLYLAYL